MFGAARCMRDWSLTSKHRAVDKGSVAQDIAPHANSSSTLSPAQIREGPTLQEHINQDGPPFATPFALHQFHIPSSPPRSSSPSSAVCSPSRRLRLLRVCSSVTNAKIARKLAVIITKATVSMWIYVSVPIAGHPYVHLYLRSN